MMRQQEIQPTPSTQIKRGVIILILIWTCIIIASALWSLHLNTQTSLTLAYNEAQTSFNKDLVYRRWASLQGGVYVPMSDAVPPNPYLDVPEREITSPSGQVLTLVNPAYMTRQVHELGQQQYGVQGHITSLDPIRPENAPDDWERKVLQDFEQGSTEASSVEIMNGLYVMRYMGVMVTEQSCLKCHIEQHYNPGDVHGGISVSVPMQPYWDAEIPTRYTILLWHGVFWVGGLLGIAWGNRQIVAAIGQQETVGQVLYERAKQYRAMTATAMDGFWVVSQDGRLLDVNAAYCQMTGYSQEELLGMSISDIEVLESPAEIQAHIQKTLKMGVDRFESCHRCKDGHLIEVEVSVTFVPELRYFCSFLRDITARKQTEEKLLSSESRWRSLVSNIPNILFEFDRDNIIQFINFTLPHQTPEEVVGTSLFEYTLPANHERVHGYIEQAIQTGETVSYETLGIDGNWYSVRIGPIQQNGQVNSLLMILTDVTNLKRSEIALRESEERLRQVVENMPIMLDVFDENHNVIVWNRECERVTGYSAKEIVGNPHAMELLYPDAKYRETVNAKLANLGLDFRNQEYMINCKDGTQKTISWSNISAQYPIPGWNNWAIGFDITDRKQTEKILQQERDRAQQYLDIAGVMFIALNPQGTVTLINHRGSHLLGYESQEIIGKNWFETFLPAPMQTSTRNIFDQLMAGEMDPVSYYENPIVTRNGKEKLIGWHNTILRDDTGQITGTLSSGEDITERRQAEQILQVRLRLNEYALIHSIDDLMQKTLDEAEQLTNSQIGFFHFLESDQKTLTLQNWSTNTLNNMCSAEGKGLHYGVDKAGVWTDCIQQRAPVIHNDYANLSHRRGMPDGHAEVTRELVVPIMRNDRIVAILGVGNKPTDYDAIDTDIIYQLANVAWDIVARKKAELELGRSEKTIALKDRFISTVSHEFRTPLAIIQTSSDLLRNYADKLTEERRHQSFQQITQQISILNGLIDGVLSINRSQTGRTEFAPTPVDLEPFCRTIFEQIQFTDAAEHQFNFISHPPDRAVLIDGTLLQHILTNLLTNAVKYSPERSRITFGLDHDDTKIIIQVSDEGIGIPEEDFGLLFEPFYRASNVGHAAGTGLGLSIVKEYVTLHGGRIEVESQLNEGSIFKVLLPLK